MTAAECRITRADILDPKVYAIERAQRRAAIVALKKTRRFSVGPYATFYFENYDTMFQQVMEMLHIEKGGEAQIEDELSAYNPLIPQGRELCATFMLEIPDEGQRGRVLARLGYIERNVFIEIDGERVSAVAEDDQERTKADGKTSSVHFLHFPFTESQAQRLKTPHARVILGVDHLEYGHMAVLPEAARAALAADLA